MEDEDLRPADNGKTVPMEEGIALTTHPSVPATPQVVRQMRSPVTMDKNFMYGDKSIDFSPKPEVPVTTDPKVLYVTESVVPSESLQPQVKKLKSVPAVPVSAEKDQYQNGEQQQLPLNKKET